MALGNPAEEHTVGVKLTADGFQSETAAKFAGNRALDEFLSDVFRKESHVILH
jgi:hypothetical protein